MRLGEAMVKEGLITNDVLAKALERQIIFGGRLGTNLVEMGVINEETLAKFLARVLRVPYAEPASFEDVDADVLDAMPKELAEKYTAFPIKRERNRLHLAMKDPNDMVVVDELRFIVGLDIRPYIASEMRIVFALEKYYGIKRDLRYVAVKGEEHTFDSHPGKAAPKAAAAPIEDVPEEEYLGDESQTEVYAQGLFAQAVPEPAIPAPAAHAEPPAPPAPPAHEAAFPRPEPAMTAPPPVAPPPVAAGQGPAQPVREEPARVHRPAAKAKSPYEILASPDDREQIAGAVIDAALGDVSRAALFMVKGAVLTGWRAAGQGLDDRVISSVSIDMAKPTLFKDVVEDKLFYKGPILQIPQNRELLERMGGQTPQEVVACPLIIKGKVVGVLYGDNGQGSMLTGDMERLGGLMAKASMSLEILILKTKILAGE